MWKIFLKNVKLLKTKILCTAEKYENTEITYDRKEINSDDTEKYKKLYRRILKLT